MRSDSSRRVVIGTYLEPELVERIGAAESRVQITYVPELLPVPRYPCDHGGTKPTLSPGELRRWEELVGEAEILFDFDWHDPASLPDRAPSLRFIQATSAGIGAFMDRTGLRHRGIEVATAGGTHAIPLAEFALTGVLHFVKGVPDLRHWQHTHHWARYTTRQLAGRRVLVIGLGGMGRRVAATFAALGVEVIGLGRRPESDLPPGVSRLIGAAQLTETLADADILIICCPLTPETEGLIGAEQIAALPPQAIVVNIGRGPVIDQTALTDALVNQRIAGAALDVFAVEPLPAEDSLWDLPNVLISPHSASTVATENAALTELFIDNLGRYLDGRPRRNRYDPLAGY